MQLFANLDVRNTTEFLKLAGETVTLLGGVWRIIKSAFVRLRKELNTIITDNINRAITEMKNYTDQKFNEHESAAFQRIKAVEDQLKENRRGKPTGWGSDGD